jgi:hypothetical protein
MLNLHLTKPKLSYIGRKSDEFPKGLDGMNEASMLTSLTLQVTSSNRVLMSRLPDKKSNCETTSSSVLLPSLFSAHKPNLLTGLTGTLSYLWNEEVYLVLETHNKANQDQLNLL